MPPADQTLAPNSVIDVSHESLMRNWRRLRVWVDEEADDARLYRRCRESVELFERSGSQNLMKDVELETAAAWKAKKSPTQAWTSLYGGQWEPVRELIDRSVEADREEREERRRRREEELRRAKELAETKQREAESSQELAHDRAKHLKAARRFATVIAFAAVFLAGALFAAVWLAFSLSSEQAETKRLFEQNTTLLSETQGLLENETTLNEQNETTLNEQNETLLKRSRLEEGRAWLERANGYLNDEFPSAADRFAAALMAGRAVGFTGYVRDLQTTEFSSTYSDLLDGANPEAGTKIVTGYDAGSRR